MELRHLRYFLAVAEERAFTRAAARLFVAQPAVSRQIRDLERHLGCQLFRRGSRGAELTEAGRRLLPRARRVVEEFDRCMAELREEGRRAVGRVRLGLNVDLASRLDAVLQRLKLVLPDVRIEPVLYGCHGGEELLEAREVDAVVTWWGEPGPQNQAVELFREKLYAVLPARHDLAVLPTVGAEEIGAGGPVAMFDPRFGERAYESLAVLLRGRLNDPELISEPMDETRSAQQQMIELARRRGAGTVVSAPNLEQLRLAGMVARPLELPPAPITLMWPSAPSDRVHLVTEAARTLATVA